MAKITVTPYTAGTVNHATNNEIANITDVPYQAGMVNKPAKNTDTTFFGMCSVLHQQYRQRQIKNYKTFGQKDVTQGT